MAARVGLTGCASVLALGLQPGWAWAQLSGSTQLSGSMQWASDDRYRGLSQSHAHPVWRAAANYDDASGWFAGALLTTSAVEPRADATRLRVDIGYAQAWGRQTNWEWGVLATRQRRSQLQRDFNSGSRSGSADYVEWFAGLLAESWSTRLYVSQDYLGTGARSLYLELNAVQALGLSSRLSLHGGCLHITSPPPASYPGTTYSATSPAYVHVRQEPPAYAGAAVRWDARLGVDTDFILGSPAFARTPLTLGLAWVMAKPARRLCEPGSTGLNRCRSAAVLSVSIGF